MARNKQFLEILNKFLSKAERELNVLNEPGTLNIMEGTITKEEELKAYKLIIKAYKETHPE
tara:strand:+ start:564 stop:746 length:183 start_codon:yes stop_codon:yes gene_type:complete